MGTDKDPTFAEALLALMVKRSEGCSDSDAIEAARAQIAWAPSHIRRALGVDKQPVVGPVEQRSRELSLDKQLADAQQDARDATTMIAQAHREKASAVARAEKAEAQAAEARDAFTLSVGERDALRAELDKAKAELADVEKRLATYDLVGTVGSRVAAIVDSREFQTRRAAQMESERDALAAKLEAARKALDAKETT